jgi:hypothetical protein
MEWGLQGHGVAERLGLGLRLQESGDGAAAA